MKAEPDDDHQAAAAFETVMAPLRSRLGDSAAPLLPDRPQPLEDLVSPVGVEAVLRAEGLYKSYSGVPALENFSLELYPGDVMGLLGPHGAGKTTAMRILATILAPDKGAASVAGHPLAEVDKARRQIGYMPDFLGVYDDLLVWEYMEFFARAYGVNARERQAAIDEALTITSLTDLRARPLDGLSNTIKQRLALARLLMHKPRVLLLDEPAAGLDPRTRAELRDILRLLREKGMAILLSSHQLEDLADLCNKVTLLDQGKTLVAGSMRSLLDRLRDTRRWRLRVREEAETQRLHAFLVEHARDVALSGQELYATIPGGDEAVEQLHATLFEAKFRLLDFAEEPLGLEDLYKRLLGAPYA